MTSLLFVDDEPRILEGLRRLLRPRSTAWDMHFAQSGAEALEVLAAAPIDVIISDMRMPGMSGGELLKAVKERYPDTFRIVLSGQAHASMVMQAFGVTHQYLAKPCDLATLQQTIERAGTLRQLLGNASIQKIVSGTARLPSLPIIYQRLVSCLRSPDASLTDVAKIIAQDIGMTAGILKVVNSAYFGLTNTVTDISRATTILGLDIVMALVLEHGVFAAADPSAVPGFDLDYLRRHSMRTAAVARTIAGLDPATEKLGDAAFLAGVLHDLGQLVMISAIPARCRDVVALMERTGCSRHTAERELLNTTHAEVGAYLLALWGFDNTLVEAVAYHECPSALPSGAFGLAGILHVAHQIAAHPDIADAMDPRAKLDVS